jgi:hypothetical protein
MDEFRFSVGHLYLIMSRHRDDNPVHQSHFNRDDKEWVISAEISGENRNNRQNEAIVVLGMMSEIAAPPRHPRCLIDVCTLIRWTHLLSILLRIEASRNPSRIYTIVSHRLTPHNAVSTRPDPSSNRSQSQTNFRSSSDHAI